MHVYSHVCHLVTFTVAMQDSVVALVDTGRSAGNLCCVSATWAIIWLITDSTLKASRKVDWEWTC